jgi:hypothetical protein
MTAEMLPGRWLWSGSPVSPLGCVRSRLSDASHFRLETHDNDPIFSGHLCCRFSNGGPRRNSTEPVSTGYAAHRDSEGSGRVKLLALRYRMSAERLHCTARKATMKSISQRLGPDLCTPCSSRKACCAASAVYRTAGFPARQRLTSKQDKNPHDTVLYATHCSITLCSSA